MRVVAPGSGPLAWRPGADRVSWLDVSRWSRFGIVLLLLAAPAVGQTNSSGDVEAAEHMAGGRWADAAEILRELVASRPSATRLFNLGQAERNLGRLADAQRNFELAHERAQVERMPAVEGAARAALADLKSQVPKLTVEVEPAGVSAEVRIDGAPVTLASDGSVNVNPGTRRLMVSAPGFETHERTVSPRAGGQLRIRVTLERVSGSGGTPAPAPGAPDEGESRSLAPLVVGGAGVVALAAGAYFLVRAQSKWSDAEEQCPTGTCRLGSQEAVMEHQSLVDEGRSASTLGWMLTGVGGAALATGIVLWTLDGEPREATLGVRPTAGGAALWLSGALF